MVRWKGLCILLLVLLPGMALAQANVISNPSFETAGGWTFNSNQLRNGDHVHSGLYALTDTVGSGASTTASAGYSLDAGDSWVLSGWGYAATEGSEVTYSIGDGIGVGIQDLACGVDTVDGWQQCTLSGTADEDTIVTVGVTIYGSAWADDVSLIITPAVAPTPTAGPPAPTSGPVGPSSVGDAFAGVIGVGGASVVTIAAPVMAVLGLGLVVLLIAPRWSIRTLGSLGRLFR